MPKTHQWPSTHTRSQSHVQYTTLPPPQLTLPEPSSPIPEKNAVELTRDMLIAVLTYLSDLIPQCFNGKPVRLVVHGGACMLLHPMLYPLTQSMSQSLFVDEEGKAMPTPARRTATRDVDYINRSFATEWQKAGIPDATDRLKKCIREAARRFGLGADWMNSDADIALPMANNSQTNTLFDPVYLDSLRPNNIHLHTVFASPNKMLTLISVTPFWAVALKLVRYTKWDPGDICALLRNGSIISKVTWTTEILEGWLYKECWAMGYAKYDIAKKMEMRKRIAHAVAMVNAWNAGEPPVPASGYASHLSPGSSSSSSPTNSYMGEPGKNAPEGWSMGGWGTTPSAPTNGAWAVSNHSPANGSTPHPHIWTSASAVNSPSSVRWVGGFVAPSPGGVPTPADPRNSLLLQGSGWSVNPSSSIDLPNRGMQWEERYDHGPWAKSQHDVQPAPVIPDLSELPPQPPKSRSRKQSQVSRGNTPPVIPFLPPGFIADDPTRKTTEWDWHGLTEQEREHVINERANQNSNWKSLGPSSTPGDDSQWRIDPEGLRPHSQSVNEFVQERVSANPSRRDMWRTDDNEWSWHPYHNKQFAEQGVRQTQSLQVI